MNRNTGRANNLNAPYLVGAMNFWGPTHPNWVWQKVQPLSGLWQRTIRNKYSNPSKRRLRWLLHSTEGGFVNVLISSFRHQSVDTNVYDVAMLP